MIQLAGGTAAQQNVSNYWQQFWRPFTISNSGNVNLAYVKPEVAFTRPGPITQLVGIPSEGNDPWRVLPFINAATPVALQDPLQIFLRTSFDDQLLPAITSPYGNGRRGIWVQKAAVGAGAPGSALYAAGNGNGAVPDPVANAANVLNRDPSVSGTARAGYVTVNIPTGSPLGQYAGSLRFFNDRS